MGEVIVKGKQYPTRVYECFDGDEPETIDLKLQTRIEFEEGLKLFYRREFPEASVVFNKIAKKNDQDLAAVYFYKRSVQFAMTGVPDDWTGVEKLEAK
jgi:two-component system sensor histidine kinase ChiS